MTAGVARKPGMTRDDLFDINASIVTGARAPSRTLLQKSPAPPLSTPRPAGLIKAIAEVCPTAFINIISNPVNSLVPMAKEILVEAGVYNPKLLTGVTTLDIVRANTFVARTPTPQPSSSSAAIWTTIFSTRKKCLSAQLVWIAEMKGTDPTETYVPVIGGHSGLTILPLLSQTTPTGLTFTDDEVDALSERIREVRTPRHNPQGPAR